MYRTHITRTVGRAFVYVCIVPSIKYFPKCNDIKAGKSHIQYRTVLQRQTQNSSNDKIELGGQQATLSNLSTLAIPSVGSQVANPATYLLNSILGIY